MIFRILVISLPSAFSLLGHADPGVSIACSLAGSVFVASVAQTNWFRQSGEALSVTHYLLRPVTMFHLLFLVFNVLGGGAFALNAAGYSPLGVNADSAQIELIVIAECMRFMLIGHTSVTVGMKLIGFRYSKPKYATPSIPPYTLIIISVISLIVGTALSALPALFQIGQKFLGISAGSILVEIILCIKHRRANNLKLAAGMLGANLLSQSLSGWKGLVLWTMITLGVMLYPLRPKFVILGGSSFILFWIMFFHPFGLALRPLLWYEGVERDKAVEISIDKALNMSLEERMENAWRMLTSRANELYQFSKYVEYVPARHSYYNFEILNDAMLSLIPRVLWPEKPDMEKLSMQRVYEADIVSVESIVSAKSNFYQDGYLSGGEFGIILSCLIFGMLVMLISRTCEWLFGGYEIGTCLIYTSLFGATLHVPQNFEFFIGAAWTSTILMFALFTIGKAMGWVVSSAEIDHSPENRTRIHENNEMKPGHLRTVS